VKRPDIVVKLTNDVPRVQPAFATEPFHRWDLPDGTPWARFYRTPAGCLVRFPDLADFEVSADGQDVSCVRVPGVSDATTEHLYLHQVLPLALSKRGQLVFHGSAVEIKDGAIAFIGESGRGKSTLAAAFATNGHRFLTDDGLVLEPADGIYQALPSHPSLRLWEDSHEKLLESGIEPAPALDYTSKARFLAGTALTHCDAPRPLRTAYFLGDGTTPEMTVRRLTAAETVIAWAKHSFLLDVEDRALIGAHFDRIAILSNTLLCYELNYPRRFDELDRLLETVMAHATNLSVLR
jgi:hypothetical protein